MQHITLKAWHAFFIVCTIGFALSAVAEIVPNATAAGGSQSQPPAEAYKAIVKIKTFALNTKLALAQTQSGSGVLVSPEGIVLTNDHVVSVRDKLFDQERETTYLLCLTASPSQAPDCSYFGRLIARDKKLDIALLKMYAIPGSGAVSRFPFLSVNATDTTQIGDALSALGYPDIGGENITITSGTVSGKQEKYGMQWLKTDAVISYGSSGGAAIDKGGNVIGITTEAFADLLGTLGYITNVASFNHWIAQNKETYPQDSVLESRLMKHARKQLSLKGNHSFAGDFIPFALNIAEGWSYEFEDEDLLRVTKPGDQEGGGLMLTFSKTPYFYTRAKIVPEFKRSLFEAGLLSLVTISSVKDVTVNGIPGQRIEISAFGEKTYFYYFVHKNYLFKLVLDFGDKDMDKSAIEKMAQSFKIAGAVPAYQEQRSFASQNPVFRVKGAKGWTMIPQNITDDPLVAGYSAIPEAYASVNITKVTDEMKGYTNAQYLAHQKQLIQDVNKLGAIADLKASIPSSNPKYKLSKALPSVIMAEEELRAVSANKVLFRGLSYTVRSGGYYLEFHLSVYSDSLTVYRKAKQAYQALAQGFSLAK